MKKLQYYLLSLTILAAIATLTSCKDDPAPSKRSLLVGKTWMVIKYEIDGSDATGDRDECDTDNTTTFFDDGTYIDDMGAVLCDEGEPDTEGTWEFKANETVISFHPTGGPESDWEIHELTENRFMFAQHHQMLQVDLMITMAPAP